MAVCTINYAMLDKQIHCLSQVIGRKHNLLLEGILELLIDIYENRPFPESKRS